MSKFKRKVKTYQQIARGQTDVKGTVQQVKLWSMELSCGHVVELSVRKRPKPPKAIECVMCAHGHVVEKEEVEV